MLHWLVDNGKLQFEENIANIWPQFRTNGKDSIKVCHVLNHTSGLHNGMADIRDNPLLICDWNECLNHIAMSVPETEPGLEQLYHYLSFGWLCGGIIEHASGKKFQEVLEEAIIHPLNIEGELYIGIPPGVESRLATLTLDTEDLYRLSRISSPPDLPSSFQTNNMLQLVTGLPALFNTLNVRRAIIPAANGHCSARALARYYATLAAGGMVPPPHVSSRPPLGSHPHIPKFPSLESPEKKKANKMKEMVIPKKKTKVNDHSRNSKNGNNDKKTSIDRYTRLCTSGSSSSSSSNTPDSVDGSESDDHRRGVSKIFSNQKIHDAFLGVGDYSNLVLPNGKFGLGFRRFSLKDGSLTSFGHSGIGGSTGFCDIENRFAIAVTLNKLSLGTVTGNIIQFVCSELNLPVPEEFSRFGENGPDINPNLGRPLIN
ncbi:uncharacterized protein LOC122662289 [Telopea speciosissima]|uniref:uncharacterized protein LOC122662289 n=1 Tax=Telopea speciosissima TaxID=54955 RepID=UPI001CC65F55|nr:uncharacterized protein LOC122662289 [Telopea speciosissima]